MAGGCCSVCRNRGFGRVLVLALVALIAGLAGSLNAGAADREHPALWRVSTAESTLYLFGTVHFLPSGHFPLDPVIEEAVAGADTLVLEIDLSTIDSQRMQQQMMHQGLYSDGRQLSSVLTSGQWAAFSEATRSLGLQPAMLEGMKPWLAALFLTSVTFQRVGMSPDQGVDVYLLDRVDEGVGVRGLESMEGQLEVFTGLSEEQQITLLMQTIEHLDEVETFAAGAVEAWKTGDLDTLHGFMLRVYEQDSALYHALISRRHAIWLPQLKVLLREPGTHFVAVGALHLPGEDGLVRGLEESGFRVERVRGSLD